MKTVITERARGDLRAIARYIAESNPKRALTFIDELTSKCEELASMPLAFQLAEGHEDKDLRRRIHGDYVIYYSIKDQTVLVIHIRSARRSAPRFP